MDTTARTMLAMAAPGYGPPDTIQLTRVALPEPGAGEVRVRLEASAINPADFKVQRGALKLVHATVKPLIVGYDIAGRVDACGPGVSGLQPGQDVFGFLPYSRGNKRGAFAEYAVIRADQLALRPVGVDAVQAATVATSGAAALQALRDLGRVQRGQRVLITGASGGVGALAVAIAVRLGAQVTAYGTGRGLELARANGAVDVIDRRNGPVAQQAQGLFHVVFDTHGTLRPRDVRSLLNAGGTFITTLPSIGFLVDSLTGLFSSRRARFVNVRSRPADLDQLAQWLSAGMRVHVDHTVPVRDVAKSMSKLEQGGVLGRIAVDVAHGFHA